MLSVDSKVIGIDIEHRNPNNSECRLCCLRGRQNTGYRNGEISRGSAVSEGTIHVTQGLRVNWGEPVFSFQNL